MAVLDRDPPASAGALSEALSPGLDDHGDAIIRANEEAVTAAVSQIGGLDVLSCVGIFDY